MLYYQNLTNTEKQSDNLIEKDIINTRSSFDISNKVQYTLKEYLTEGNNKSPLVLPTYKPKGYEVAYINSDEKDRIIAAPIFPTELAEAKAKKATAVATKPSTTSSDDSLLSSVQELADEC
ncbi:MAG: hypothetical protein LBP53_08530 [Candidatus Peribacteria bacterium]|jgi:hypothetical protein|nr:hypothetical protein [Candidatus Peribacteria bacterium]